MITVFIIGACGLLGLLAVVETALYYAGVDALAFNITLLMGVVLSGGIAELFWVSRRTNRLRTELAAFPPNADFAHVEKASPLLRALLSARIDRSALPVPGPVFTPFIVSLLVMLGLLGTFLGLFETLRGAGYALDASADVEALRNGLKAPISGLMRSFGTSAAGVATSAMLGLSAVFVRRDGGRFGVALHTTASGELARYTPVQRQLVALEKLAEQGDAWPKAAAALERAVQRLDGLGERWQEAHAQAAQQTREQLGAATQEIQQAITHGVERAAGDISAVVKPLVAQVASETGELTREHLQSVRQQVERWTSEREKSDAALLQSVRHTLESLVELEQTRGADGAQRHEQLVAQLASTHAELLERVDAAEQARSEAFAASERQRSEQLATLEQARAKELVAAEQTRVEAFTAAEQARARSLREGFDALSQTRADADAALLARIEQGLEAVLTQEQARAQSLARSFEQLAGGVQEASASAAERDTQRAAALAEVGERANRDLAEAAAALLARIEQSSQALLAGVEQSSQSVLAQVEQSSQSVLAEMKQSSQSVLAEMKQSSQSVLAHVEQGSQTMLAKEQARAEALAERFEQLAAGVHEAFAGAAERDTQRAAALADVGARMQHDLAEAAALVRERLTHGAEAEAKLQQRTEELFERLSKASGVIAESAETQAGALAAFVEATDGRLREAEQASHSRLSEVLSQWSALGEAQGERMAAFEQSLLGRHEATVAQLGTRLGEHAQTLDTHLAESAQLLRQAATLVHAGGAELSAVAESFAGAVASQREGAREWLASLGDIERYALESGEAAAADALGQHLARTHEIFDRQLRFQQELIDQLQGMRRRDSMVAPRADVTS